MSFRTLRAMLALLILPAGLALAQADGAPQVPRPAVPDEPPVNAGNIAPPPTIQGVETIEVLGEAENASDVQDKAQAITAFSGADLERASIVNIDSLAVGVPGLHVGQSGQEAIVTLRGIGTENASITGEPGVAFHVDGIDYAQPAAARLAFFDLETLDVKLGPQGLSGGKNSTSGSINVVTKKPTDQLEVKGDLTYGNYNRQKATGAINIPFGETLASRVAFIYETRDGFLDNKNAPTDKDPFDVDDRGMRAHLLWTPTDTLQGLFTYNYYKQGGNGPQADLVPIHRDDIPCKPQGAVEFFNVGPSVMPALARCNFAVVAPSYTYLDPKTHKPKTTTQVMALQPAIEDDDPRVTYSDFLSSQSNRFWGWTSTVDWDAPEIALLGGTHLKLLGGFQDAQQSFNYDQDATNLSFSTLFTTRGARQYSSELQWSGSLGERLEWQTGGLYMRETGSRFLLQPQLNAQFPNLSPPPLVPPTPVTLTSRTEIDQDTENQSYGAWLNGTYSATDSIQLNLGGRWIKDKKREFLLRDSEALGSFDPRDRFIGCNGSLGIATSAGGATVPAADNPWCSATYRGTMWGAGIDWHPGASDTLLLYARIDRGHKSGGFRAGGRGTYKPEKNWAYSAGAKSTFLDGKLQLNLDGFFYNYQDMQIVILDDFSQRTENTDARMYGWDFRTRLVPIEGLTLQGILSFLHTETIDYFSLDPADVASFTSGSSSAGISPQEIAAFNERRLYVRYQTENYQPEDLGGKSYAESTNCLSPPTPTKVPALPYLCGLTGVKDGLDDFSGNQLSRSPEWKYTLSAEYEFPLGSLGSLTPRVQYAWQDDTYFRAFNRDFDLQKAFHQTDAKLIWSSPEQRWDAEVFVTNIEDEAPKQNLFIGSRSNGSPPIVWWGPPRFYGVRVGFKY